MLILIFTNFELFHLNLKVKNAVIKYIFTYPDTIKLQ